MSANNKYRPSLTGESISHILSLARLDFAKNGSDKSLSIITVLSPFDAKVKDRAVTAAYTITPKLSQEEALGFSTPTTELTKEVRWLEAYNRYIESPDTCTISEISDAKEHMYLNSLMTPEEVQSFEEQL